MKKIRNTLKNTSGVTRLAILIFVVVLLAVAASLAIAGAIKPSRTSTIGSNAQLRGASPAFQNFVIDKPRVWLPASGGSELAVASLVGLGSGTPAPTECNTSEVSGFLFATTNSFSVLMPVPADIDLAKDIRLRALFSNSEAAGTGTVGFTFTFEPFIVGTTAIAVADDACDTDGAVVTDLAANVLTWSNWSTIDGGTIDLTPGDDFLIVKAVNVLVTAADATGYGIQMEYHRKWLGGDGSY